MKNDDIFLIFAQNIDREAVLTSTHNLCCRAKLRKNEYMYLCKPQFYYIKVGCKGSTIYGHVSMMIMHRHVCLMSWQTAINVLLLSQKLSFQYFGYL